jgi:hypothetical protein
MKRRNGASNKHSERERFFSIELNSKEDLRDVSISNGGPEGVLLEGTIGQLRRAEFAEGIVLEVVGIKGVLTINVRENEIGRKEARS